MTIEERVENALADLEGLLAEGAETENALKEAAATYGLKAEVLRVRAEPMGDLEILRTKYAKQAKRREQERAVAKLVDSYVDEFFERNPNSALPFIPINRWIVQNISDDQRAIAFAAARARIRLDRNVKKFLNGDYDHAFNK